jgi:hypothetical protein
MKPMPASRRRRPGRRPAGRSWSPGRRTGSGGGAAATRRRADRLLGRASMRALSLAVLQDRKRGSSHFRPGRYRNVAIKSDRLRAQKKGAHSKRAVAFVGTSWSRPRVVWGRERSVAGCLGSGRSDGAGQVVTLGRGVRCTWARVRSGQPRRLNWKRSAHLGVVCVRAAGLLEQRPGHPPHRQAEPVQAPGLLRQLLADGAWPAPRARPTAARRLAGSPLGRRAARRPTPPARPARAACPPVGHPALA